jgi:hypothetical protein
VQAHGRIVWWLYVIIVLLFVAAIWGFTRLIGLETRWLSHKTTRRAEDLYDGYGDRKPKQDDQ